MIWHVSSRVSCISTIPTKRILMVSYLDWFRLKYYCRTLSSRASCIYTLQTENTRVSEQYLLRIQRVSERYLLRIQRVSERYLLRIQRLLYLAWYRLIYYCRTWSSRLSCFFTIHTDKYRGCISIDRYLRIQIRVYLDWYRFKTELIGVRHLVHHCWKWSVFKESMIDI